MSRGIWKFAALALAALAILLPIALIWFVYGAPSEARIMELGQQWFDRYGMITVLVCALIEGVVVVGWYFPGTTFIVLGLLLAAPNVPRYLGVVALCAIGLSIAYVADFLMGKHGWYRLFVAFGLREPLSRAQRRVERHGLNAVLLTYWQFGLASLTSTAAGVLQFPFWRFVLISTAATVLWVGAWSTLIYFLGRAAMTLVGLPFIVGLLAIWLIVQAVAALLRRRSAPNQG